MPASQPAPDATPLTHRERLAPTEFWWLACVAVGACLGLVFGPPFGRPGFVFGAMAGVAIAVALLLWTSAAVVVDGSTLRAGRAVIDLKHVSGARPLTPEQMSELRGPKFDPRAYLCQRSWIPAGVQVTLDDPADPTPYWLVSTRHALALAQTIEVGARAARRGPG